MSSCVIFGGSGFIGTHLAQHFLKTGRFQRVHIADIAASPLDGTPGISFSRTDVRSTIESTLVSESPQWIFNLAAVHREPGHEAHEYFETNLAGARNVCELCRDGWMSQYLLHEQYFSLRADSGADVGKFAHSSIDPLRQFQVSGRMHP